MTTENQAPEGGERAAFDAYWAGVTADHSAYMCTTTTDLAWGAWQASAALAAQPQAPIATVMGLAVYDTPASQAPAEGDAVPDLYERLAEAHDASLDDDHRACRSILTECMSLLVRRPNVQPKGTVAGYVMKGREFPSHVFYPASHRPTDINNFDTVYFDATQAPAPGAVPPRWVSDQVSGEFDDLTAGQGYRKGWNDCRDAFFAAGAKQDAEPDLCQNCGDLAHPGCNSEFSAEPACRFWGPGTTGEAPDGAHEALQRLIENAASLGPASRDDARLVAKWRRPLLSPREVQAPAVQAGQTKEGT